jgi:hypothetical protein
VPPPEGQMEQRDTRRVLFELISYSRGIQVLTVKVSLRGIYENYLFGIKSGKQTPVNEAVRAPVAPDVWKTNKIKLIFSRNQLDSPLQFCKQLSCDKKNQENRNKK